MSTAKFDTWKNTDGTENYKCRAWVNFDGTGTPSIRASGNVDSITDNGTGDYTVNFITAMPDTNYAVTTTSIPIPGSNRAGFFIGPYQTQQSPAAPQASLTTASVRIACMRGSSDTAAGVSIESNGVYVAVFR